MKVVIFVRHGESEINAMHGLSSDINPYKLTEKGINQARTTADKIAKIPKINALYTSPILRAKETAEIIGKRCKISPKIDDRLLERAQGKLNNRTWPSDKEQVDAYMKEIYAGYKGGFENWSNLQKRMSDFANSIKEEMSIAVSHSDPILALLGTINLKYDDFDLETKIPMASITVLDFEKRQILCIGSSSVPASLISS